MKLSNILGLALLALAGFAAADLSQAGGAGHSLIFRDHGVVIENFSDLAPDAFTFEAWLRTSDNCHRSAIFSYANRVDDPMADEATRTAAANAFVIFDQKKVVACHDFEYIDLWPDPQSKSCYAAFNANPVNVLPSIVENDGTWHHLAVTWTAANDGFTKVYVDGLLRAEAGTGKTGPLKPGGALMLGAEQDCYGGCTDRGQGFYGEMDEVRIWRVARSQQDILNFMRNSEKSLERHPDLAAYWRFNDPEGNGISKGTVVAKDYSGRGNDLHLIQLPTASSQQLVSAGTAGGTPGSFKTLDNVGVLSFHNNYAMNQGILNMPQGDLSIEFWARTPAYNASTAQPDVFTEFLNYAAVSSETATDAVFLDDAILIEKYSTEYRGKSELNYQNFETRGSVSVHINSNRQGMGQSNENWVDFAVHWVDASWHHVAFTWSQSTGEVSLYFDGRPQTAFWRSNAGAVEVKNPFNGVAKNIAAGSTRSSFGSLVLGNKQESFGGGFSPQYAMTGDMANLRIWNKVLSEQEILTGMFTSTSLDSSSSSSSGLALSYHFDPSNVQVHSESGTGIVTDTYSTFNNDLYLGADAPLWTYSTAPLALPTGAPVSVPTPGSAGHAFYLSDQQVLIHKNFQNFPSDEVTVEFWMLSTDTCRKGTPFSYATGSYGQGDNSLLIFDYNDWGVSVMEDEGTFLDHTSGIASTDGKWTHVAMTWQSHDGATVLYINGREVWTVTRGRGQHIPSGGTLVLGREQDVEGGGFDSGRGAVGPVQTTQNQEYGAQDFFGLIDEMRIWKKARTQEQIAASMRSNLASKGDQGGKGKGGRRGGGKGKGGSVSPINPSNPDLVAYWTFDEGKGYTVRDMTGHGHDLLATQPPRWEVVRFFAVCGNGVLEGLEECDTGNVGKGTGCTTTCEIEGGWECTETSPSKCWRVDGTGGGGGFVPGPAPSPGGGSSDHSSTSHHKRSVAKAVLATFTSIAISVTVVVAAITQREAIYDRLPIIETAVGSTIGAVGNGVTYAVGLVSRGLGRLGVGGGRGGGEYSYGGDLDPLLDAGSGSPSFTASMPPPGRGVYSPLPARAPQGP